MQDLGLWCRTCGGEGIIDEDQAKRLGVEEFKFGHVAWCPKCGGSGHRSPGPSKGFLVITAVFATIGLWAIIFFVGKAFGAW
jgi:hypothetical protein